MGLTYTTELIIIIIKTHCNNVTHPPSFLMVFGLQLDFLVLLVLSMRILTSTVFEGRNLRKVWAAVTGIQRQTRSPPLPFVWWEVTCGPVTRTIFVSPSKQLLCPCGIDPEWHCRVGSAVLLSAGNPGVPNRSTSHGPSSPSGSRFTQLQNTCGLAHCHFYSSSSTLIMCDSACVSMQPISITLFVPVG